MDLFLILLAVTTIIRGFGAGLIFDVALISLPARRQIGAVAFTKYAIALFTGNGARIYAPVAILGAFLTLAVTAGAFVWGKSPVVIWSAVLSLLATVLTFWGTLKALPTMMSLRDAPNEEPLLARILDRFAYWHTFSAVWQLISFMALVVALTSQ